MRIQELMIYRGFSGDGLLKDMVWLMENCESLEGTLAGKQSLWWGCVNRLLELGASHGFYGNLWHCYLADLLVNHENSYSLACEIRGEIQGSLNAAALHDMAVLQELFAYDFSVLTECLHVSGSQIVFAYEPDRHGGHMYSREVREGICVLAAALAKAGDPRRLQAILTEFYKVYGVGKLGLHKAFRIRRGEEGVRILPISGIAPVSLKDLVGYEAAKKKLTDNTEAFVRGRRANNCLLYGAAGTGKSSSIKAIVNAYYEEGLRIIELYKHQFHELHDVVAQIKHRNYKFIIYMDDLSFEEFETEYKYLKAVIEGGLEKRPDNVLIYATSNRRHLVREKFSDRQEGQDDLHFRETVQEKLSLAGRFGVTIYFHPPDKKEFDKIVEELAKRHGIDMPGEELLLAANRWELSHGGLSGRTARQFIDHLLGQMHKE